MPVYYYFCEDNGRTVEVEHTIKAKLVTWGEVCFVAQIPLGDTDPLAPVSRVIKNAPNIAVPLFNSELKGYGFTKLVKREDGVYENVTAGGGEKRYMKRGDKDSIPHIHKKVGD
jgi:hypothetical protein